MRKKKVDGTAQSPPPERPHWETPRILTREPLEAVAAVCTLGKANPGQCPAGPISS